MLYFFDGYDDAVIGTAMNPETGETVVAYSVAKVIAILKEQGATYEEAVKFLDYELRDDFGEEKNPIFVLEESLEDIKSRWGDTMEAIYACHISESKN